MKKNNEVYYFKPSRLCPQQRWEVLRDFSGDDDYYLVISKDTYPKYALLKKNDRIYYDGQYLKLEWNQCINEIGVYKHVTETGIVQKYLIIDIRYSLITILMIWLLVAQLLYIKTVDLLIGFK